MHEFSQPVSYQGQQIKACYLHHTGRFKTKKAPEVSASGNNMESFASEKLVFTPKAHGEDALRVLAVQPEMLRDLEMVRAMLPVAEDCYERLLRILPSSGSIWEASVGSGSMVVMGVANRVIVRRLNISTHNSYQVIDMLHKLIMFLVGWTDEDLQSQEHDEWGTRPLKDFPPPIKARQNICRETKLMDALFEITQAPNHCNIALRDINHCHKEIHGLCFKVINLIFLSNHSNEEYFARQNIQINSAGSGSGSRGDCSGSSSGGGMERVDWIPATVRQIGDHVGASDCLTSLLSNNKKLLEIYVKRETVRKFMDLIRRNGPRSSFMLFFISICSCEGTVGDINTVGELNALLHLRMQLRRCSR
jgi:hypothetical protein